MAFRQLVRQLTMCGLILCGLCPRADGVGYDDFPENLRRILDERIDELNAQAGVCIAGRVTLSDGAPIRSGEDVMVNTDAWGDLALWVYEGGWFIMDRTPNNALPAKPVHVRAFGYDPLDIDVDVRQGEVTYLELQLVKTPPAHLASVAGIVRDENNQPFNGAWVSLRFPFSNHGYRAEFGYTYPHMEVQTGPDGRFRFYGLSATQHRLTASAPQYAYHAGTFTTPAGGETRQDRQLYPNRRIVIDYVYQPNGGRRFDDGAILAGTVDWLNGTSGGLDFSLGQVLSGHQDLYLRQTQDVLKFRNAYVNPQTGFYDAGAIPFDSVTEAGETGYSPGEKPCLVGHVYVVRTFGEGHYVKFIVRSDECSFRTVVPGDPDPIRFAGYGLTIDFAHCDGYGQVYVRKYSGMAPGLGGPGLPYYHEITGMDEKSFEADILLTYDPNDVADAGLSERGPAIYRSCDDGLSWHPLDTEVDRIDHALRVQGIDTFGLFAVAGQHLNTLRADLDGNAIVDFADLAALGQQWHEVEVERPVKADLDGNGIVGVDDLTPFSEQWLRTEAWYLPQ